MNSLSNNKIWFRLLISAVFLMQLGSAAGSIGVPILAKKLFDTSLWGLAMIGATGTLVYSIVCYLIGGLVKRANPYRMMMAGLFFFALAFFLAIFASTTWHLLLIYILAGASAAFFWPMVEAALVHGATGSGKNNRIGVFNVSWSLADALGTAIAGGLYLIWPRLPFVVLILCLSGAFVFSFLAGRISRREYTGFDPPLAPKTEEMAISQEVRQGFTTAAWMGNFVAHGITGVLRSVFTAPAVDVFKMSPLSIGLAIGTFNALRTLTFALMRHRNDWAYHKGIFSAAHLILAAGMVLIIGAACLSSPALAVMAVFGSLALAGVGCGVIYYSSIYYSINLSELVASHTRLHETFLGAGATSLVLGSGGLHSLLSSPQAAAAISRIGADPFVLGSLSPFLISTIAVAGVLALTRRLFLNKIQL